MGVRLQRSGGNLGKVGRVGRSVQVLSGVCPPDLTHTQAPAVPSCTLVMLPSHQAGQAWSLELSLTFDAQAVLQFLGEDISVFFRHK